MTAPLADGDSTDTAGPPRVVLDEDGLDRLELVLGGWLAASAIRGRSDAILTDAENTPLARVRVDAAGAATVEPLADLARGAGPQWDPAVRLAAAAVRRRLDGMRADDVEAIVVDTVPTRTMTAWARASTATREWLVVLVTPRRVPRPAGEVNWAGLTRAAWALADELDATRPGRPVLRLVTPSAPATAPDLGSAGIGHWTALPSTGRGDGPGDLASLDDVVERAVRDAYPPASAAEVLRARRGAPGPGAVVFFTGLSGSGKSTIARALADELADDGPRRVTLLDGDEVRQHLSRGLGFDAESREINIDRIAWVASLVAAHGGIAVAAPIAPFAAGRRNARALANARGVPFLLVWVSTPIEVCEARDRKGLYARARAGEVADFTGISSPYEPPDDADVVIDTAETGVPDAVRAIREALEDRLAGSPPDGRLAGEPPRPDPAGA